MDTHGVNRVQWLHYTLAANQTYWDALSMCFTLFLEMLHRNLMTNIHLYVLVIKASRTRINPH